MRRMEPMRRLEMDKARGKRVLQVLGLIALGVMAFAVISSLFPPVRDAWAQVVSRVRVYGPVTGAGNVAVSVEEIDALVTLPAEVTAPVTGAGNVSVSIEEIDALVTLPAEITAPVTGAGNVAVSIEEVSGTNLPVSIQDIVSGAGAGGHYTAHVAVTVGAASAVSAQLAEDARYRVSCDTDVWWNQGTAVGTTAVVDTTGFLVRGASLFLWTHNSYRYYAVIQDSAAGTCVASREE